MVRPLAIGLGPVLGLLMGVGAWAAGLEFAPAVVAATATWCAVWWLTEVLPLGATSLLPFAVFPLLGITSAKQLAASYGHPLIVLLLGGFLLSAAMERSGTHRRLALALVSAVGGGGSRLVLGFMLTSAFLSMWISNSATTLMLLPVGLAVIAEDKTGKLTKPLLLGIAYGASIGGVGTPIGTPPNLVLLATYRDATGSELSFLEWMRIGIPAVCILLPLAWWTVTRQLPRGGSAPSMPKLGPWQAQERRVLVIFGLTALAWVTRSGPGGGWQQWLPGGSASDSTVALWGALLMFICSDAKGGRLLDWNTARKIPWGLLLLFAGGMALAAAFKTSGLSGTVAQSLGQLSDWPQWPMLLVLCLAVTFLTELTSNTATATLLMPILAATAVGTGQPLLALMVPAALSASCAFMLPVATAPNAIVFGSEMLTPRDMASAGLRLNLLGALLLSLLCYWLL